MKIVFMAPFGIRPKGTVIARALPLAAALQDRGDQVVIVLPPYTNREDSGKEEVVQGVKLVNVRLPELGKALSTPFVSWRMYCAVMAEQPDIVHLFKPKGYGAFAALLLRMRHSDLTLFVDTDDLEGYGGMNDSLGYSGIEKALYAWQERMLMQLADGVTAASRGLAEILKDSGRKSDDILYLPNCIEPKPVGNRAAGRSRIGIPADAPVLLLYTRFFEFEQPLLHRLFARLAEMRSDLLFLVVGKGRNSELEQLAEAATAAGFRERLMITGWVEPVELPDIFAAADVAIYPFRDDLVNRTKCPAKLTELMAAGLPVIADRVGEPASYIVDGESGVLCNAGDELEMVDRVLDLLSNYAGRIAMGEAARHRMQIQFSWCDAADRMEKFYRKYLC